MVCYCAVPGAGGNDAIFVLGVGDNFEYEI